MGMAKSMKKAMKSMKKSTMKSMKKKSGKKGMRKAKRVSKVAKGRGAKARVFRGLKEKTSTGLTKSALVKNKVGRVVSKKKLPTEKKYIKNMESQHGRKRYNKHENHLELK